MRVGYFVKEHGQTLKDTIYFKHVYSMFKDEDEKRELVRDACEYAWQNNDGWEWLRDEIVITLVIDDTEVGDFPV